MLLLPIIRLDTPTSSSSLSKKKNPIPTNPTISLPLPCSLSTSPTSICMRMTEHCLGHVSILIFIAQILTSSICKSIYLCVCVCVCVGILTSFVSQILFVHLSWCLFIYQNPSMPAMKRLKSACKRGCCNHFNLFWDIRNAFLSPSLPLSLLPSLVKKYFNNFAV